tara:strand:- start:758 stop:976 length:219 start_codon:yes stop_codon:yes gene_type:complete
MEIKLVPTILLVNAVFWGLFSHKEHCALVSNFGINPSQCPPHYVHLMMGLAFYAGSVYYQQSDYIHGVLKKK